MRKWIPAIVLLSLGVLGTLRIAFGKPATPVFEEFTADSEIIPPPRGTYKLEIEERVAATTIRVGELLPVRFWLRNAGKEKVTMAFGGYDHCALQYPGIRDGDFNPVAYQRRVDCGTRSPLRAENFLVLEPDERLELRDQVLSEWRPTRPGTYTVEYTLDSRGSRLCAWTDFRAPKTVEDKQRMADLVARLRTVPQTVVRSNPVMITVVP